MVFTIYVSFIYIYKYESKINYFNKLSVSSSLPYSSSSEYSSLFSMLPLMFHLFRNLPHIYKIVNILFVILGRSMPLSLILKVKIKTFLNYVFSKTVSAVNVKRLVMMIKMKTANGYKENS